MLECPQFYEYVFQGSRGEVYCVCPGTALHQATGTFSYVCSGNNGVIINRTGRNRLFLRKTRVRLFCAHALNFRLHGREKESHELPGDCRNTNICYFGCLRSHLIGPRPLAEVLRMNALCSTEYIVHTHQTPALVTHA